MLILFDLVETKVLANKLWLNNKNNRIIVLPSVKHWDDMRDSVTDLFIIIHD
ncbi:hypothetical protein OZD67_05600 [Wolbachia endosymbiont of Drosophila nikananu]|uniref:hypothetical protein n=1 Tax=Wolbachia endosymbiont of Drosophila nikananu TaxID=375550 RepID=UPI0023A96435|nr:hypothetical protein [Wolbachia endosymbiont of Drosophila nikananu]MDE5061567.1 hypothetical protein [Wolbachia endosymbiont of Drosophila nikananu]